MRQLTFLAGEVFCDCRSNSIKGGAVDDCTIPQKPMLARQGVRHDMSPGMTLRCCCDGH